MMSKNNEFVIRDISFYTDGAYSSKTEMGGWACLCIENNELIDVQSGYEPYTTGNRMELKAILTALELADTIETGRTKVTVYTDSAYCANTFNQGWFRNWMKNGWKTADKQDVKNQDILRPMIALYIKLKDKLSLEIVKVPGHQNIEWNKKADALAVKKRKELEV